MSKRLINVFQDTQKKIWEDEQLHLLTSQSMLCTQVFPENYDTTRVVGSYSTGISVTEETTFQAASRLTDRYMKIGVLNFANGVNPGGGVVLGARAQEEDLCRCSNLYPCLTKPELYESFYGYNNSRSPYYSDRVLYSPNIMVIKNDRQEYSYLDNRFQVDVLTCAAPNLIGAASPDIHKLEKIYCKRIRNILAVAEAHGIQALVLGAFGCGAYMNPPEVMAKAFYKEITQGEYKDTFQEIVFAIKTTSPRDLHNLSVFRSILSPWQENPIYGKKVSILGDSISTYWGSSPDGYRTFYNQEQCIRAGMYSVNDMWWKILIDKLGGTLLMNNSCAGSCVSGNSTFSGNNDNRIYYLCDGYESPDVILVSMGMSDFEYGIQVEPDVGDLVNINTYYDYFKTSYQTMLWKLRQAYPQAEIYCATIKYGAYDGNTEFLYINGRKGAPLREYNRVIRECAAEYGCCIADIVELVKKYDSVDGIHPTAKGMEQLAAGWMKAMNDSDGVYYFQNEKKNIDWQLTALYGVIAVLVIIIILLIWLLIISL